MEERFDKNVLFKNISFLLKEKGIKIGELENEAGVSLGYISRTSKEGKPGVDFIVNVSDILEVSIDVLLKCDISSLSPNTRYIIAFLRKLISDTQNDKLNWNCESRDSLDYGLDEEFGGTCDHQLFSVRSFQEVGEMEYPETVTRPVFMSRTFDIHTCIHGDCYNLKLKKDATLYVMNISKSTYRLNDPNAFAKEIWICSKSGEVQFVCSTRDVDIVSSLIEELYDSIATSCKHPSFNGGFKAIIDDYMKDDSGEDGSPF